MRLHPVSNSSEQVVARYDHESNMLKAIDNIPGNTIVALFGDQPHMIELFELLVNYLNSVDAVSNVFHFLRCRASKINMILTSLTLLCNLTVFHGWFPADSQIWLRFHNF